MTYDTESNTMTRESINTAMDTAETAKATQPRNEFDNNSTKLAREGTRELISSEKVDGTAVFDRTGEKLGSIHHFMVGKRAGKVRFAVMSFGGLFGMGEDYYPLPWTSLTYDTELDGYKVNLTKDQLDKDKAPHFARDKEPEWNRDFDQRIDSYYIAFV